MSPARFLKLLWASPCTAAGLPLAAAALLLGGCARRREGTLEVAFDDVRPASRAFAARLPFRGIALGHVIVAASPAELERLRGHERVHVAQCERWGPFFFAAYLGSGAWQWLRGGDAYWDNPFEVEARRATAGSRRSAAATPPPPS